MKPIADSETIDRVCRGVGSVQEGVKVSEHIDALTKALNPLVKTPESELQSSVVVTMKFARMLNEARALLQQVGQHIPPQSIAESRTSGLPEFMETLESFEKRCREDVGPIVKD